MKNLFMTKKAKKELEFIEQNYGDQSTIIYAAGNAQLKIAFLADMKGDLYNMKTYRGKKMLKNKIKKLEEK